MRLRGLEGEIYEALREGNGSINRYALIRIVNAKRKSESRSLLPFGEFVGALSALRRRGIINESASGSLRIEPGKS